VTVLNVNDTKLVSIHFKKLLNNYNNLTKLLKLVNKYNKLNPWITDEIIKFLKSVSTLRKSALTYCVNSKYIGHY